MPRIKRGVSTKKTHRKIKRKVKGFIASRQASIKRAQEAILKAGQHAYIDRRRKKREHRALWILRINNACRQNDIKYSSFIKKLKDKKIGLDRKILASLAVDHPEVFETIVKKIK